MPCSYCGRDVEEPQWITTHNTITNRQRLIHYYLNENETCLHYTVCRPSCLLERLRHELQEMRDQLDGLVRLADLIEIEHTLQLAQLGSVPESELLTTTAQTTTRLLAEILTLT